MSTALIVVNGMFISKKMISINTIIFSKNRACQLELLLRSLNIPGVVLYTYDPEFKSGYAKVKKMYPAVKFVRETNFRKQLIELVRRCSKYGLFLVDDDIMIRPFDITCREFEEFKRNPEIICLSLRLSPDHRWRGLPELQDNKYEWQHYSRGSQTFNYRLRGWGAPMTVAAHMFRKEDILPMIEAAKKIKTPNYLEQVLNINIPDRPLVQCFAKAKFVNNEINQVQTDFPSHTPGPSARQLNKRFLKGERLSLADIIGKAAYARDYFMKTDYNWEKETK